MKETVVKTKEEWLKLPLLDLPHILYTMFEAMDMELVQKKYQDSEQAEYSFRPKQ